MSRPPTDPQAPPLLAIEALSITFPGHPPAVRRLDLELASGEMVGLVGESGSGKSQTLLSILGLSDPRASIRGHVRFGGQDILGLPERELRRLRGRRIALVFQDPLTSLNPSFTIGWQVEESLRLQRRELPSDRRRTRVGEILAEVGLPDPTSVMRQFPHELSGGMRQRALLAIALAADPELLLADEPTTALDVTIAAEILDLLDELRRRRQLGVLFVSHDLNLVASRCDRVVVIYAGVGLEVGPAQEVFGSPLHPYSRALSAATVDPFGPPLESGAIVQGDPVEAALHFGCPFASRCPHAQAICGQSEPQLRTFGGARQSACVRQSEITEAA